MNSAHLIERFTRVDGETLMYVFTVIDPETWESSWTAEVPMRRNPEPVYEYACHEGNYSMEGAPRWSAVRRQTSAEATK